jgi:hypothetical protein
MLNNKLFIVLPYNSVIGGIRTICNSTDAAYRVN